MMTAYHRHPTRQRTRRAPRSPSAPRPPARAAVISAAAAGTHVHSCPTTPTGTPAARGTHTAHVMAKTRTKKAASGRLRIDLTTFLPPARGPLARRAHPTPAAGGGKRADSPGRLGISAPWGCRGAPLARALAPDGTASVRGGESVDAGSRTPASKVAIVTAAGKGIGAACARELAARGYSLALMSRSGAAADLARELGGIGLAGSVTEEADLRALVEGAL